MLFRGLTVSDLHLFSHHSRTRSILCNLEDVASSVDLLVLNGDIFDFKWTQHGGVVSSVEVAMRQLEHLLGALPNCEVHVVLGNHDAVPAYQAALNSLSEAEGRFYWHEFVCQLEDRIFLHGDVVHAGPDNAAIRQFRDRMRPFEKDLRLRRVAHDAVHRSKLPRLAFGVVPKRLLAARILRYLENEGWLRRVRVSDVYFGHTHSAFENFTFRGIRFHNSGSSTLGARLRPIPFTVRGACQRN